MAFKSLHIFFIFLTMIIASGSVFTLYNYSEVTIIWVVLTMLLFTYLNLTKKLLLESIYFILVLIFLTFSYYILLKLDGYEMDFGRLILLDIKVFIAYILVLFIKKYKVNYIIFIYISSLIIMIHADIGFLLQFIIDVKGFYSQNFSNDSMSWYSIYNIFFYSQLINKYNLFRSQGMMWEPGILEFFINFVVYYNLFYRRNLYIVSLAAVSLIATLSTTGFIIFFLILLSFAMKKSSIKHKISLIIIGIFVLNLILFSIVEKFNIENNVSFVARLYDIEKSLHVIFENYIFGIGYNENNYSYYEFNSVILTHLNKFYLQFFDEERGITNSFLLLGVYFGLPFAVIILMIYLRQRIFLPYKLCSLMLIIFLSSEPIILNPFFLFLIILMIKKVKTNENIAINT